MRPRKSKRIRLFPILSVLLLAFTGASPVLARSIRTPEASPLETNRSNRGLEMPVTGPLPCDEATGLAGPFPCKNVDLLGYIPGNLFGGITTADIWGWTDPETGREYAIVAHANATSFVDVTDPVNPVFVGELLAPVPNVLWRDVKVYKDHAYIVGDGDFVLPHGIQVFDLTQLRDLSGPPVVFEATARYLGVGNTHNFAINEATGTGFAVGSNTCSGGLHMLDLNSPPNPVFLGCFSADGYTHDTMCVTYHGPDLEYQGREICVASNEDTVTVVDVTDKSNPVMLARQGYAGHGYTHQGDLTDDHAYFILGDELDEQNDGHNTYSYLWDLTDLNTPSHIGTYVGPSTSIDHNLFIVGRYVFESNYTSGLRILDNAEIATGSLTEVAYFDTHPASDVAEFAGSWSNYPYFASGIVIVSNIEDGLYILKPNLPGFPVPPAADLKAAGGGWLATLEGKKLNFGFEAASGDGLLSGSLQLNDKAAGVKIDVTTITSVGEVEGACGSVSAGENALELLGDGTFNDAAAGFRICITDNGEPGSADLFYLECTAGCTYNTGDRTPDDVLDGGNIQVVRAADGGTGGGTGGSGDPEPTTIVLDPLLQTAGIIGQLQTFTIDIYDQYNQPMSGVTVTLSRIKPNGTITTFTAVTGLDGVAVISSLNLSVTAEYIASVGTVKSNAILLDPILK